MGSPLSSLGHAPRIANLENKTSGPELKREKIPGSGELEDAYTKVRRFMDGFGRYCTGKLGSLSPELYESRFSVQVPPKELGRLGSELKMFSEDDRRFPRYEYDASTSTLIIQCMPSPVHESIVSAISSGFNSVRESLPAPIRRRIGTVGGQTFVGFLGRYQGSKKTPDLAVEFTDPNGVPNAKFILEAGFSESYEDLVQSAKLWLEGKPQVSVVMIVKFQESPPFKCPARNLDDENLEQLQFPALVETEWQQFIFHNIYGPVVYRGLEWVERFETVFAEVWRRDAASGLATQSGDRVDLLRAAIADTPPPALTFRLSEFLNITPNNDRQVSFRWGEYQLCLQSKIRQLAVSRCQEMLDRRRGFTGPQDDNYPSPSSEELSC